MLRRVALMIAGLILVAISAVVGGLILSRPQPPHFVIVQNSLQTSCSQGDALISLGAPVAYTQNYIGCNVTAFFRNEGGDGNGLAVFHALMFPWAYESSTEFKPHPAPRQSAMRRSWGVSTAA
jgi:hypothetical protein